MSETLNPNWRKSSYSGGAGNDCVEVADNQPRILVRDTKLTDSPVVDVAPSTWAGLVEFVRHAGL